MITEKDIKKLLMELNSHKAGGCVITRPLSGMVEYAKVWFYIPSLDRKDSPDNDGSPYTFYFISEKGEKYVAAILVLENDLKWYLLPECRKGNLFSSALKETILPHLLQHKPVQCMTLNKSVIGEKAFLSSRKIILSAGFKLIREEEALCVFAIEAAALEKREYITGENTRLPESRIKSLSIELNTIIQILEMIKTEIVMKTGSWEYGIDYEGIIKNLQIMKKELGQF